MTLFQIIIEVAQLAGIVFLFIARQFFPSYIQEKAKNLATKQDVREITDRIKSIESHYEVIVEKEKSKLQLSLESAVNIRSKTIESIIAFFEDCISLFGEKLATNLGDLPIDEGKSYYAYETETKQLFRKIFVDYHRLLIYLKPNESLNRAASEVIKNILEMEKVFRKHITGLKNALKAEALAHQDNDKEQYRKCVSMTNDLKSRYDDELGPPLNSFRKAFMAYIAEIQDYLSIDRASLLKDIADRITELS